MFNNLHLFVSLAPAVWQMFEPVYFLPSNYRALVVLAGGCREWDDNPLTAPQPEANTLPSHPVATGKNRTNQESENLFFI